MPTKSPELPRPNPRGLLPHTPQNVYKVRMKAREVIAAGWVEVRSKGSHRQFKHPERPGLVTVATHSGQDIKAGTLASIERQSGLKLKKG